MSSMSTTGLKSDPGNILKRRYKTVTEEKAGGATYTPKLLADFVAMQIFAIADLPADGMPIRVLDPAVGDGELLLSILERMPPDRLASVEIRGFETDASAMERATGRIRGAFPEVKLHIEERSFLDFVLDRPAAAGALFAAKDEESFDLIIANPPYVRTQIMGATQAQSLAAQFGLSGRVDLYHAFLLGMSMILGAGGTAGVIVSNRFMTTKSGSSVRRALREAFRIRHVWDLGDTKLFDAAVLPAVLVLQGKDSKADDPRFTSIYETTQSATCRVADQMTAVLQSGTVAIADGRRFEVRHGILDGCGSGDGIWRIATEAGDTWLATVRKNAWGTFRDIGKTRVGVKTCADSVFIRNDWDALPAECRPELLRGLVTHHVARRFRAKISAKPRRIVYPQCRNCGWLAEWRSDLE